MNEYFGTLLYRWVPPVVVTAAFAVCSYKTYLLLFPPNRFGDQFPYLIILPLITMWMILQWIVAIFPKIYRRLSKNIVVVRSLLVVVLCSFAGLIISYLWIPRYFVAISSTAPVFLIVILWLLAAQPTKEHILSIISVSISLVSLEFIFRNFIAVERIPGTMKQFQEQVVSQWPREVPVEKLQDKFRILGLSDSFGTSGGENNYHYLLPNLLASKWDVEMVNMSMGDLKPIHEVAMLKKYGKSWHPDLVLYGFYVGDNFISREGKQITYYGQNLLIHEGWESYLLPNWALLQWMAKMGKTYYNDWTLNLESKNDSREKPSANENQPAFSNDMFLTIVNSLIHICCSSTKSYTENFEKTLEYIDELVKISAEMDAQFLLVIHPAQFQIEVNLLKELSEKFKFSRASVDLEKPQRFLLEYCQKRKIKCIDLMPSFRQYGANGGLYLVRETHYNREGNLLAARTIADFTLRRF